MMELILRVMNQEKPINLCPNQALQTNNIVEHKRVDFYAKTDRYFSTSDSATPWASSVNS